MRLADRRLRRLSYTQYRSSDSESDVPASKVVIHIDAWDETAAFAGLPRRAYIWSGSFATNEIDGATVTPRLNYTEVERIAVGADAPCEDLRQVLTCPRSLVQHYESRVVSIESTVSSLAAAERRGGAPSAAAASRAA
ncbi:MAG: hypothetical protein RLZZ238_2015 [Planctomycetota bacterium]